MRQISKIWGSKILKRGRPLYMVLYHMLMAIYVHVPSLCKKFKMHSTIYMICNNLPEIILNSNSQTRFSARILDTLPSCTHCGTLAGNALSRLSPSLSPWPTTCPSFSSSDMTSTKVESNRVLCEQIPSTLLTTSSGPNLSSWRSFPTSP